MAVVTTERRHNHPFLLVLSSYIINSTDYAYDARSNITVLFIQYTSSSSTTIADVHWVNYAKSGIRS